MRCSRQMPEVAFEASAGTSVSVYPSAPPPSMRGAEVSILTSPARWVETAPDSVSYAWADSETPAVSSDRIQAGSSPVSTLAAPSEGVSVIWSKSPG